jgi:hypothetical protein
VVEVEIEFSEANFEKYATVIWSQRREWVEPGKREGCWN